MSAVETLLIFNSLRVTEWRESLVTNSPSFFQAIFGIGNAFTEQNRVTSSSFFAVFTGDQSVYWIVTKICTENINKKNYTDMRKGLPEVPALETRDFSVLWRYFQLTINFQSINPSIHISIWQSTNQSVSQWVGQSIRQLTNQLTNGPTNQSII